MALKSYRDYVAENERNDTDINPFLKKQPEEIFGGSPGQPQGDAPELLKKLIEKHGTNVRKMLVGALASGEFSEDIEFEGDIKELIGRLPKIKHKGTKIISKKKKIQQDPLNNVVSRTHSGADSPGSEAGGGGGEG